MPLGAAARLPWRGEGDGPDGSPSPAQPQPWTSSETNTLPDLDRRPGTPPDPSSGPVEPAGQGEELRAVALNFKASFPRRKCVGGKRGAREGAAGEGSAPEQGSGRRGHSPGRGVEARTGAYAERGDRGWAELRW